MAKDPAEQISNLTYINTYVFFLLCQPHHFWNIVKDDS